MPHLISDEVVILTRAELKAREDAAFKRGVERGRFEESYDRSNPVRNGGVAKDMEKPREGNPAQC